MEYDSIPKEYQDKHWEKHEIGLWFHYRVLVPMFGPHYKEYWWQDYPFNHYTDGRDGSDLDLCRYDVDYKTRTFIDDDGEEGVVKYEFDRDDFEQYVREVALESSSPMRLQYCDYAPCLHFIHEFIIATERETPDLWNNWASNITDDLKDWFVQLLVDFIMEMGRDVLEKFVPGR